jgi:hypothetical protein
MNSNTYAGTQSFMAPAIKNNNYYGSEIDFFSAGLVLLNLINKDDFSKFLRKAENDHFGSLFSEDEPENYLENYLATVASESLSTTEKILNERPVLKSLIQCYLKTSVQSHSLDALKESKSLLEELKDIYNTSYPVELHLTDSDSSTSSSPLTIDDSLLSTSSNTSPIDRKMSLDSFN